MSSRSPAERPPARARPSGTPRVGVIACGALSAPVGRITARRGWPVDVHPLPPLLHNRPAAIAPEVAALARRLRTRYAGRLAVAYADCGTYGALDAVCAELGLARLAGRHCYDTLAGGARIDGLLAEEPGTYLLTDFLVRAFDRVVVSELGLDRWPELRDVYFGRYRRVVWLASDPTPELATLAERAAAALGLPLQTVPLGDGRLERELALLMADTGRAA